MNSADQPKSIPHYRVARHLGSGSMGEVFLAEDTKSDCAPSRGQGFEFSKVTG
jgi:hypothetical protein